MKIKELINRRINKECITEYDKNKIFNYLRHIPNAMKTDKEFKLYCDMAKDKGLPAPERHSKVRPLEEDLHKWNEVNIKWKQLMYFNVNLIRQFR